MQKIINETNNFVTVQNLVKEAEVSHIIKLVCLNGLFQLNRASRLIRHHIKSSGLLRSFLYFSVIFHTIVETFWLTMI